MPRLGRELEERHALPDPGHRGHSLDRPESRLGGVDLAIRLQGETTCSTVIETKWSRHGLRDAPDEAPWDCVELAHAGATLGIEDGLLVYVEPAAAWTRPARLAWEIRASSVSRSGAEWLEMKDGWPLAETISHGAPRGDV